jgi:hypothetical protein
MTRLLAILLSALVTATAFAADEPANQPSQSPTPPPDVDGNKAAARRGALELAGAFSNDGYKIRDGYWYSSIETDKPAVLKVNLFAGNEYWFCASVVPPGRTLTVIVTDSEGYAVDQQDYTDETHTAAGVEPNVSGEYYIQVALTEGDKSEFCLLYTYK